MTLATVSKNLSLGLVGEARVSESTSSVWAGHYDLGVIAASWDPRCTEIACAPNLTFGVLLICAPKITDRDGLRKHHDVVIKDAAQRSAAETKYIYFGPAELEDSWAVLREGLWQSLRRVRNSGLRLFLDITTCPRYLTLALLKEALSSGLCSVIDIGYTEGDYPPPPIDFEGIEEVSFKSGPTNSIVIPGYLGDFEPGRDKTYLVSAGFDGWKTLNQLNRRDPKRVALIFADPGVRNEYVLRARRGNAGLIERFGISASDVLCAPAGDAITCWKVIQEWASAGTDTVNLFFLCAGNKPHSLALALYAMDNVEVTLLYNQATRAHPVKVKRGSSVWMYRISPRVKIF